MSAIYDDYRRYKDLCEKAGIEPLPMRDPDSIGIKKWYSHYEELLGAKNEN